jgi:hypothetical protein
MGFGDFLKPLAGIAGAALGWYIGGPIGGAIGWGLGMGIGGALFPAEAERMASQTTGPAQQQRPTANLGAVVSVLKGTRRVAGNLIWYEDVVESAGGAGWVTNFTAVYGGTTAPANQYLVSFAFGVSIGTAQAIRMYLGKNEYVLEMIGALSTYNSYYAYRINVGENVPTEYVNKSAAEILALVKAAGTQPLSMTITQYYGLQTAASAAMAAAKGASVPPYRNLHYITFENFPVSSLGAGIPTLSFEVNSLTSGVADTDVAPQSMTNYILTDEFVGMGLDPTTYLETTETAAAEAYVVANDLLYSFVFDNQRSVLDSLQYVIQHHNGFITYADGKIAHRQLEISGAAIAWATNVTVSDAFTDNTQGTQWAKVD